MIIDKTLFFLAYIQIEQCFPTCGGGGHGHIDREAQGVITK